MTHEERLALIALPFPPIGGHTRKIDPRLWAGTIIGDNFFGDGEPATRRARSDDEPDTLVLRSFVQPRETSGAARVARSPTW